MIELGLGKIQLWNFISRNQVDIETAEFSGVLHRGPASMVYFQLPLLRTGQPRDSDRFGARYSESP